MVSVTERKAVLFADLISQARSRDFLKCVRDFEDAKIE